MDRTATSLAQAARMLLSENIPAEIVEQELRAMKQPTRGYLYVSDVLKVIKNDK